MRGPLMQQEEEQHPEGNATRAHSHVMMGLEATVMQLEAKQQRGLQAGPRSSRREHGPAEPWIWTPSPRAERESASAALWAFVMVGPADYYTVSTVHPLI